MSDDLDPARFRQAMGRLVSGVSVVTTLSQGVDHAMTADTVTSVSLEPLLVLVCVENFGKTVEQVVAKTQVRQTIVTSIGELLGFKGIIVDYVVRHRKKLVPTFSLPGSIRLSDALAEGRKRPLERVEVGHDDIAFLQ